MNNEKRIVVYTVIMGDYDYLKDPEYVMENCDYICFTNNPDLKSDIWEIRYDSNTELDNTRWQRRHKVLAHEYLPDTYEWCIYVDGNVRITGDLRKYINLESGGGKNRFYVLSIQLEIQCTRKQRNVFVLERICRKL